MSLLEGVVLLNDLTQQEKNDLALFCQSKHLNCNDVLFREGEDGTAMYFLKKWKMSISKHIHGVDVVLWTVQSEEILWEMALFWQDIKRMATATAIEECELVVMLSFSIKKLTEKYPELLEKIKWVINKRLLDNKMIESNVMGKRLCE